jgi:hypothetical protein
MTKAKWENYTLPSLLIDNAGNKVTTVDAWEKIRRPEIIKLFEDYVYGQVPNSV